MTTDVDGSVDLTTCTAQVQALAHIDSAETYTLAGTVLTRVIARMRQIADWYAEERAPFIEVQRKLKDRERASLEPWQALQDVLQTAMRDYEAETKAARKAALEAAMAQAAAAQVPVRLPDLATQTTPKVEGLQSRELWSAEVEAFAALVVAVGVTALLEIWEEVAAKGQGPAVEGCTPEDLRTVYTFLKTWRETAGAVPLDAVVPNMPWLNAQAREYHASLKLPGVQAVKRESYARGRTRRAGGDDAL